MHISSIKPLLAKLQVNCAFWVLNKTFRLLLAWRGNLISLQHVLLQEDIKDWP